MYVIGVVAGSCATSRADRGVHMGDVLGRSAAIGGARLAYGNARRGRGCVGSVGVELLRACVCCGSCLTDS